MCVTWINISESCNSFMTGAGCYWGGKKRCLRKSNNHVAVDVFIHVFVNDATRDPEKTTR